MTRVLFFASCLLLLLLAHGGAARAAALVEESSPVEREIELDAERSGTIRGEVERALQHHLGDRVSNVSLGLTQPRLLRRGNRFELLFEEGRIVLNALEVGGIQVNGHVDFEDLRLDYGALGVGRFELVADPRVYPNISTSLEQLELFMKEQGLRDTSLVFDEEAGEIVMSGRRPARVFLFRVNPMVTVRGGFVLEDNQLGFHLSRLDVRDASGPVCREVEHRVRRLAAKRVDLNEVLSGLKVQSIRVAGGEVRILGGEGGVLFAHRITQRGGPAAG